MNFWGSKMFETINCVGQKWIGTKQIGGSKICWGKFLGSKKLGLNLLGVNKTEMHALQGIKDPPLTYWYCWYCYCWKWAKLCSTFTDLFDFVICTMILSKQTIKHISVHIIKLYTAVLLAMYNLATNFSMHALTNDIKLWNDVL